MNLSNINQAKEWLQVLQTTDHSQAAVMRLGPGEATGKHADSHEYSEQLLLLVQGVLAAEIDSAVLLCSFEKTYRESGEADGRSEVQPGWASQVQKSLTSQADAVISAKTYQDAAEAVLHLKGQILLFQNSRGEEKPLESGYKCDWEETISEGLRKTYCQGRRLMRRIVSIPEPSDGQWHELRKRAKDLGYQLALLKKLKGVKSLLARLEKLGKALGDARDLSLLRDYLDKAKHERELRPAQQRSFHQLLTYIDQRLKDLHGRALKVAQRTYRRGKKRFLRSMEKCWRRWEEAYS
jgi:hypothetical protein